MRLRNSGILKMVFSFSNNLLSFYFSTSSLDLGYCRFTELVCLNGKCFTNLAITEKGRYFARNVAMVLDAYLGQDKDRPVFSKTV